VTEAHVKAAAKDPAAHALLVGKTGNPNPKVGDKFILKPAISYAK
jgi:hypothetical protein